MLFQTINISFNSPCRFLPGFAKLSVRYLNYRKKVYNKQTNHDFRKFFCENRLFPRNILTKMIFRKIKMIFTSYIIYINSSEQKNLRCLPGRDLSGAFATWPQFAQLRQFDNFASLGNCNKNRCNAYAANCHWQY